jgi:hypothetical protein
MSVNDHTSSWAPPRQLLRARERVLGKVLLRYEQQRRVGLVDEIERIHNLRQHELSARHATRNAHLLRRAVVAAQRNALPTPPALRILETREHGETVVVDVEQRDVGGERQRELQRAVGALGWREE